MGKNGLLSMLLRNKIIVNQTSGTPLRVYFLYDEDETSHIGWDPILQLLSRQILYSIGILLPIKNFKFKKIHMKHIL